MHTLIVEDDEPLAEVMRRTLAASGISAKTCRTGQAALAFLEEAHHDLVIMALSLPDRDGLGLLGQIRAQNPHLPLIVVSHRHTFADCVKALDLGADDYVTKPFSLKELAARCGAVLRRRQLLAEDPVLRVGDLELNRLERRATRAGRPIDLTPRELELLEYLMQHEGESVSRAMILENAWKVRPDTVTNTVDVYVNYLRKKIDEGSPSKLIQTVRGSGYRLTHQTERSPNPTSTARRLERSLAIRHSDGDVGNQGDR